MNCIKFVLNMLKIVHEMKSTLDINDINFRRTPQLHCKQQTTNKGTHLFRVIDSINSRTYKIRPGSTLQFYELLYHYRSSIFML